MKYKIGYISKISGLSTRTIRFYEQKGLLVPEKDPYTNYRYYTNQHIMRLQQILLYKELDLSLDTIYEVMKDKDSKDLLRMLEKHLLALEEKSQRIQNIITTVHETIKSIKGEKEMKDEQKFEGLKDKMIHDHDKHYKQEVIKSYGKAAYEKSKNQFKHLTKETFDRMNHLDSDLISALKSYKANPSDEKAQTIFNLHKAWITISWGDYDPKRHKGVATLYVEDERFTKYYDQHGTGLANILRDIIHKSA